MFGEESHIELSVRFGGHIRSLRESKQISSAEMARRCLMDRGNYTRIETGITNPTLKTITILCQVLELSYSELFKDFEVKI